MAVQIVRHFWRTVFTHVVWRRGQMVHLLPKHPRAKRRVRQHANAEDKVCRIPVGVDKIIGQRQLYAQARIACRQAGKSWGYVLLAENTGPLMRIAPDGSTARASSSRRASSRFSAIDRA